MNLQEPGPVANAHTANIRNTTPPIKVTATNWEKKNYNNNNSTFQ